MKAKSLIGNQAGLEKRIERLPVEHLLGFCFVVVMSVEWDGAYMQDLVETCRAYSVYLGRTVRFL